MKKVFCKRIVLFLICISVVGILKAQKEKLEAAYIYQFTKYVEWCPAYKTGDFVIAVIGSSPLIAELEAMAQTKKVINQTIVIKKLGSAGELSAANIVVITGSKSETLPDVLGKISGKCSLVISEKSGQAKNGAGISFTEQDGKVAFELNKEFFSSHSLSLSSQLTSLAKAVY